MKNLVIAVSAAALAACADLPAISVGSGADNPSAAAPVKPYVSVTSGTADYTLTGPKPWLEQNKLVAPAPRQGE
jgi:hypothetical protein